MSGKVREFDHDWRVATLQVLSIALLAWDTIPEVLYSLRSGSWLA